MELKHIDPHGEIILASDMDLLKSDVQVQFWNSEAHPLVQY